MSVRLHDGLGVGLDDGRSVDLLVDRLGNGLDNRLGDDWGGVDYRLRVYWGGMDDWLSHWVDDLKYVTVE